MKLSTLFKAFSIFAIATSGKTVQDQYMNPIEVCNDFPLGSPINATIGSGSPSYGINEIIEPQQCLNVSAGNTTLFLPSDETETGNVQALLNIQIPQLEETAIGKIEASKYSDMIYSNDEFESNTVACTYRTSKNQILVTPTQEYVCPLTAPVKDEEEQITQDDEKPVIRPSLRR